MIDFYVLPTWVMGLIVVVPTTAFAVAGTIIVQRLVPTSVRVKHNDVAGFLSALVGVVYAVILAFLAIAVWEAFGRAESIVEREASAAGDVATDARPYPAELEAAVRTGILTYLTIVLEEEWPLQRKGQVSLRAWRAFETVHRHVLDFEPQTAGQQIAHAEVTRKMNHVLEERRHRIFANGSAIGTEVWVVILIGSAIVISFGWFFGTENARAHVAMMGMVGLSIGLVLFLIAAMDHPFRGGVTVSPSPYQTVQERVQRMLQEQPPIEPVHKRKR